MKSKQFTLNRSDFNYIFKRGLIFLLPLVLLYFPFVIANIEKDGFQFYDFGINAFQTGALVLYILNRITTAIQLFLEGSK